MKELCGMQLFRCCAVWSFARLRRLKLALDWPRRTSEATEHSLVTPSWQIVYEKLIRNEVTNNSSTVCHCYATAEVGIETQVTSQKYVRFRSK